MSVNKIIHKICCYILSFFLSLFILSILQISAFYLGFFNSNLILEKINETNYHKNSYEEFIRGTELILKDSKIPISCVENEVELNSFYMTQQKYIKNILEQKDGSQEPDVTSDIAKKINDSFENYINSTELILTDEYKNFIQDAAYEIQKIYDKSIAMEFVEQLVKYKIELNKYSKIIIFASIPIILGLSFLLIKMQRYVHKGFRYISFSILGSALILIFIGISFYNFTDYKELAIREVYYEQFIDSYFKAGAIVNFYMAAIGIIIGVINFIITKTLKSKITGEE